MTSDSESKDCSLELVQDPAVPDLEAAVSPEPRELSVEDLVSARDILLGFFPPELVYIILDLAQYWARTTSIRDDTQAQVKVTTSGSRGKGATLCYLTTPPILGDQGEEVHLRVMRVECVIVSHDPTPDPPWYGNDIWFETAILRPGQVADPAGGSWLERAVEHPIEMDATAGYDDAIEVGAAEGKRRWMVQKNVHESDGFRRDCGTWDANAEALSGSETGVYDRAGFIGRLAPGDHIAVIARAVARDLWRGFRGCSWRNLRRVDISVYYGLV